MPYLIQSQKEEINKEAHLNTLSNYLSDKNPQDFAGCLNYCNFKIVKNYIQKNGKKYWIFALIVGTLICCVLEIYRRLVAPYEEIKIKDSGDVE